MEKITKASFKNLMTSAKSVEMIGFLNFKDVEILEADNNTDILFVIDNHTDSRLNKILETVPDFTTGRTYKARSKDMISSEETYLTYQNTTEEKYDQYRTKDGLILNVLNWFDKWDNVNRKKIMIYAIKTA